MTVTDTFTPVELDSDDLKERGIDVPRQFVDAWLNDARTITVRVYDEDGANDDPPCNDYSGEDAWEWIQFDSGHERNEWIAEHFDCANCNEPPHEGLTCPAWDEPMACEPPERFNEATDFWIERYEHGLVRYAPIGESSMVDRQWDVAPGVAIMRFTKPETIGPDDDPDKLLNFARAVCEEYTDWCNGNYYGMLRFELHSTHQPNGFLEPADFTEEWVETDSCWGFLGDEYSEQTAKTGDW